MFHNKNPTAFVFLSLLEVLLQPAPQFGLGFLSWWKFVKALPWFVVRLCCFPPFFIELINGKLWEICGKKVIGKL